MDVYKCSDVFPPCQLLKKLQLWHILRLVKKQFKKKKMVVSGYMAFCLGDGGLYACICVGYGGDIGVYV